MANRILAGLCSTLFVCVLAPAAHGADRYPVKPIRMIVPFPAGGGVDFVARVIGQKLTEALGQLVVVDNRSGASGLIGADAVAKSAPDGYTVLLASPAEVVIEPSAGMKTPYDPHKDLVPVTLAGETPLIVAAHPTVPVKSIGELIAYARSHPSNLSYGTPGLGSAMQFAGETIKLVGKVQILHVPYKGAAPAVTDLVGGQIPIAIVGMPPMVPMVKANKVRGLAVTVEKRSPALPDVAAITETQGFEGVRYTNWMGVFVSANTPAPIVEVLNSNIARIVHMNDVKEKLATQGVEAVGDSVAQFKAFLDAEFAKYSRIAKTAHITME